MNRPPSPGEKKAIEPASTLSPVLYLPHGGGPLPLLGDPDHADLAQYLRDTGRSMETPSSILVISAHWEEAHPTITGSATPGLLYDYYGFPKEAYEIDYPLPGAPELADKVASLLTGAGLPASIDAARPFDHGVFVPLKLMFPEAAIPCVQLSLVRGLAPEVHIALGRAIAPLRRENVLVLGSGMSYHNLRSLGAPAPAHDPGESFHEWLIETCCEEGLTPAARHERLVRWSEAPGARLSHPREEHLIPLHVCWGAAEETPRARLDFDRTLFGHRVVGMRW